MPENISPVINHNFGSNIFGKIKDAIIDGYRNHSDDL